MSRRFLHFEHFHIGLRINTNDTHEKKDVCNNQDKSEATFGEPHLCSLS